MSIPIILLPESDTDIDRDALADAVGDSVDIVEAVHRRHPEWDRDGCPECGSSGEDAFFNYTLATDSTALVRDGDTHWGEDLPAGKLYIECDECGATMYKHPAFDLFDRNDLETREYCPDTE